MCVCVRVCARTHACVCACMHACLMCSMSGHVCVCVCVSVCVCVCVCVCLCQCVCVCVCDVPACTRSHECVCVTGHTRPLTLRETLHVRHGASQGQLRGGGRDVDVQQQREAGQDATHHLLRLLHLLLCLLLPRLLVRLKHLPEKQKENRALSRKWT